jgi:hypothetical protein
LSSCHEVIQGDQIRSSSVVNKDLTIAFSSI